MVGWISLGGVVAGFLCFAIGSESYYNEDKWMFAGVISFIVAVVCGVILLVGSAGSHGADAAASVAKAPPAEQQTDEYWYNRNYNGFLKNYKLTAEQFPRKKGETKAQLQVRIRNWIDGKREVPAKPVVATTEEHADTTHNYSYGVPEFKAPEVQSFEVQEDLGGKTFKTSW